MQIRRGRFGRFIACSKYPECKTTKNIPTGVKCSQCGGDMVERRARGRHFYGCSNYPTCRFTTRRLPDKPGEAPEAPGAPPDDEQDKEGAEDV